MNPAEYVRMHALETNYWWFAGRRALIERLLHRNIQAETHLLDIGCGTGANLPMLRDVVGTQGRVLAMDFSPLALQFARQSEGVQDVSLLQGDGMRLPFASATFDAVTMFDVLEHLSNDTCALREIHRVLRPGGTLVLSVPAYQKLWSMHDEALHHFRRYEFHGLQTLLKQCGFVARLSFAMSLMPPFAWAWRRFILPFRPHRPRQAQRHSEGAVLPSVPPLLNRALVNYLKWEGSVIARRPLKFGTSLVCVARRA